MTSTVELSELCQYGGWRDAYKRSAIIVTHESAASAPTGKSPMKPKLSATWKLAIVSRSMALFPLFGRERCLGEDRFLRNLAWMPVSNRHATVSISVGYRRQSNGL